MVRVLFFAQLKEQLGCSGITVTIKTPCTLAEIKQHLTKLQPSWQPFLSQENLFMSVNQTMGLPNHTVKHNDEVAFFPPVTGG